MNARRVDRVYVLTVCVRILRVVIAVYVIAAMNYHQMALSVSVSPPIHHLPGTPCPHLTYLL